MKPVDRYVRVYHSIRSDERFVDVYPDDAALAAWLRMLIDADAIWPEPATIPRHSRRKALDSLAGSGLIELLPNGLYRVHGLDAERARRTAQARSAARGRWSAEP